MIELDYDTCTEPRLARSEQDRLHGIASLSPSQHSSKGLARPNMTRIGSRSGRIA